MPDIQIEDIEDLYSLYVFIFGVNENDFWHLPLSSVHEIAMNKSAFEQWKLSEEERRSKQNGK
jgi:hypothetical protein